ncbi:amidotransferase [Neptunitalea chrysea]|uniref:Amidotransferase n=1 Tax=Neptunitalea chrysea TaxID=1647581 RepID=A0A9W6B4P5_9FLAO|nr:type 1 glutamine amidotransferase [Neptunitalea chrysea]GLB51797.1 amidotransferase [Neptunitalea chrysea]
MKKCRVHYLQHEPFEGIGCIAKWGGERDYEVTGTHFYKGDVLPQPNDVDLLVVMGGPMNIYKEDKHPWLKDEKVFIKEVIGLGKYMVGICLGAQLIADVLGAKVIKNPVKEIGWYPLQFNSVAKEMPLFKNIPEEFLVLHWHGDTFEIPEGAVHLASSENCVHQAYLYNEKVLGFQFHIEVTQESLVAMIEEMNDELNEGGPFVQDIYQMHEGANYIVACNGYMFGILDRLLM